MLDAPIRLHTPLPADTTDADAFIIRAYFTYCREQGTEPDLNWTHGLTEEELLDVSRRKLDPESCFSGKKSA